MSEHFLVTGTGRCGTTWASQALRSCGIACGHQAVFRHEHTLGAPWSWGDYQGDSSFEAVPLLGHIDAQVVLLVRHPLKVIASWLSLGCFGSDMRDAFQMLAAVLDRHFPDVLDRPSSVQRAATFWREWNIAAWRYAHSLLRIEGLQPSVLAAACGHGPCSDRSVSDDVNAGPGRRDITWSDLGESMPAVAELAEAFGYEVAA